MTPEEINIGKKPTEQESNFMNSFIWYKPKYEYFNPLTGLNAIHVCKLYEADSPYFLGENLFLNPFTNQWVEWTEEFRDKLKKHYAVPAKPQQVSIPATEKELETINRKTVWIKNKRNPDCMGHVLANDKIIDENWLVFNPDTKCWEDWSSK